MIASYAYSRNPEIFPPLTAKFFKKNSKRSVSPYVAYLQARGRKIVETDGSLIERLLP
jgi:hypothetical protein